MSITRQANHHCVHHPGHSAGQPPNRVFERHKKEAHYCLQASGTSLTGLSGAGPVIVAAVIGDVKDVSRFPGRDHFAAYDGTAPIEVSSGQRTYTG